MPGAKEALISERQFIDPHLDQAIALESPIAHANPTARPELIRAVQWIAGKACDYSEIKGCRDAVTAAINAARLILEPNDAMIRAALSPSSAKLLAPDASLATMAACTRVMGLPDTRLCGDIAAGFPCYGSYSDSGMFREKRVESTRKFCELHFDKNNADVARLLELRGGSSDPKQQAILAQVTKKTYAEEELGLAEGPFMSMDEVNEQLRSYDPGYVDGCCNVMSTFGVEQGIDCNGNPSVRRCDNAKRSHTNECLSTFETIACENADFPSLVAALFAEHFPGPLDQCPLTIGLDDVEKAYRRMAALDAAATVVAIWDTNVFPNRVTYWTMPGHNFGLASAVLSFNRCSQFAAQACRRFYGMPIAAYFDDYCMVEPTWCRSSAKEALRVVHRLMGMSLASGSKDVPMRFKNCFLGVITDFSRFHRESIVVVQSKPVRVAKAIIRITEFLAAGVMSRTDAGSLAQKLEYTTASGANGRIGRAALAALRQHQYGDTETIGDPLAEALQFFLQLLPLLPPRLLRFRKRKRRPIVVYTDAMYTPGAAIAAQVGVVIFDPEAPAFHPPMPNDDSCDYRWRHTSAVVSPEQLVPLSSRASNTSGS